MDPVSIAGAIVTVTEIITVIYRFSKDARESKKETSQLCSELFGLKATFEHVGKELEQVTDGRKLGFTEDEAYSPLMRSEESELMVLSAASLLEELERKLQKASQGRLQRLKWPLKKSEILEYVQKLERHRSYFVLALTSDDFELSKQIYKDLRSAKVLIEDQYHRQLRHDRIAQQDALNSWLAPCDPQPLYEKALSEHHPATGRWFLQDILPAWVDGGANQDSSVIWLRGRPGTGKTTLISSAIRDMLARRAKSNDIGVAFFFSTFNEPTSADPRNVIGSYLEQLGHFSSDVWQDIQSRYYEQVPRISGDLERPSIDLLQNVLVECSRRFARIYLFLDGPNESDDPRTLLTSLFKTVKRTGNTRLAISSTESLLSQMPDWSSSFLKVIDMPSQDINDDIGKYIESCLHEHDRLRSLPLRLKDDIRRQFVANADGSFQWVKCQLQSVLLGKTPKEIRAALANVPPTLEQTYCNELMSVPEDQKYLVRRIFLWLTFAPMPMTPKELYEAILIEEDSTTIDEDWRLLYPMEILHSCGKLIRHGSNNGPVTLAHSSVRSYLTSPQLRDSPARYFAIDPGTAHTMLARYCLTYLCFENFQGGRCDRYGDVLQRFADWPMLRYSARAFPEFARLFSKSASSMDAVLRELILNLLESFGEPLGGYFGSFIQAFMPGTVVGIKISTPLYFAARENLNGIVKLLLATDGKRDLEIRGGRRGSTPLHVASAYGNLEVVKTLLDNGADATEINEKGESGVQWALRDDYQEIVDLLLQAGADRRLLNNPVPVYQTPRTLSI